MTNPTDIKLTNLHNLVISADYDTDPNAPYPVLLYTPYMKNTATHYHIKLSLEEAARLRNWLDEFLRGLRIAEGRL